MTAVLDASALVALLTSPRYEHVRRQLPDESRWCAPDYIKIETLSAIRRMHLHERISAQEFTSAALALPELDLRLFSIDLQIRRMIQLTPNATAFDAGYLVLSELLDAPLYTCDAKLASVPGVQCQVIVFAP
jgi:predicted nucleic acid-binding protein